MLVLSRNVGQQIIVGDGIVVTVLENRGGRLKLGIEAPADVPINRAEIYARKMSMRDPSDCISAGPSRPR